MTLCVISSTEDVNGIFGAGRKVSLAATMDSMSWSVAMLLKIFPIIVSAALD
jgi:hypothetical protein